MIAIVLAALPFLPAQEAAPEPDPALAPERVVAAAEVAGLTFATDEIELMLPDLAERREGYARLRAIPLANSVPPALRFLVHPGRPVERGADTVLALEPGPPVERPADLEELAWADVMTLAALVRARRVSCVELAETFLARLERLDGTLHCVVTLTRERALEQARRLDRELEEGRWRGPLHGLPWGAKDLLAVEGHPTTWGAAPFREQRLEGDAHVVRRLDEAGAVLIAKLTLGALAWGDVWFGGTTRNPWNPEQGSSGSSAGSASATAAGGVVFSIGSETLGSIVSPSDRCGASSLRPTFGSVGRSGAMTLSWSMDKLGPICRSARDAAVVFAAIHGADPGDPDSVDAAFRFAPAAGERFVVGYPTAAFDESEPHASVLEELEALAAAGAVELELVPVELPDYPASDMTLILSAEAAAAFDDFTRADRERELVRQERHAWPNVLRHARLIPAVDYVRANRLRTLLQREMEEVFAEVDVIVHPSFGAGLLHATNLTGHPTVVAPCGFRDDGTPYSVSFTGRLHDEGRLLALVDAWQRATGHHLRHPDL